MNTPTNAAMRPSERAAKYLRDFLTHLDPEEDEAAYNSIEDTIRELDAAQPAPKDREKDRERFSDPAFNRWLDEGISDAGHTVYDTIGSLHDAWLAWQAAPYYCAARPAQACCILSEDAPVACCKCHNPQPEQPASAVCVCPQFSCPAHTFQSLAVSPPSS